MRKESEVGLGTQRAPEGQVPPDPSRCPCTSRESREALRTMLSASLAAPSYSSPPHPQLTTEGVLAAVAGGT